MWNVSSSGADFLFDISNVILVIGAAAVLLGTIGSIKMGAAKEYFSNIRISDNERETSKANVRTAELTKEAEELRQKNLTFETALSPRWLEQNLSSQALRKYAGAKFVVVSPNDFEARRTAGQIRFMLEQANWVKATEPIPDVTWFPDGVSLRINQTMRPLGNVDSRLFSAVEAVIEQLRASNISAMRGPPDSTLPPLTIVVIVGIKPLPPSLQPSPDRFPGDASGHKSYGNTSE